MFVEPTWFTEFVAALADSCCTLSDYDMVKLIKQLCCKSTTTKLAISRLTSPGNVRFSRTGRSMIMLAVGHSRFGTTGHTAAPRDERAPSHSITSSARPMSEFGMASPKALAVFKLMTNSTLVTC
jgi:hypothetical protein